MLVLVATPLIMLINAVSSGSIPRTSTTLIATITIVGTLGTLVWLHKISASVLAIAGIFAATAAALAINQGSTQDTTIALLLTIVGVFALAATRP
jgi:cell division protein ZapA (FtsZ GTPase activity inhibitor)